MHAFGRSWIFIAITLAAAPGCASRDSLGSSAVAVLGAGVINDPSNKSLRFDILKFGLDSFCTEMLKGGAPLKFGDDEPVVGRFFADSCQSQVLDDNSHKSFVVQYTGRGYAWTNVTRRIGFASRGVIEYATDFQLNDGAMYVYFRPRLIDGAALPFNLLGHAPGVRRIRANRWRDSRCLRRHFFCQGRPALRCADCGACSVRSRKRSTCTIRACRIFMTPLRDRYIRIAV